jgi:UDP-N-acetylmuramoyl-tripeptide--D-alanyl-D-alanine ligase
MVRLAKAYRDSVPAVRIGITGSNGKTTTKEIAYTLISSVSPDAYRSSGNLNNLYGVPLALFAMPLETKFAVFEMGVSIPGEMSKLADIVRPQIVAITNVGATHLEFLGSVEGVAREKLSLIAASDQNAKLIVNADDSLLMREAGRLGREHITFGVNQPATYRAERVEYRSDGTTAVVIEGHRFTLSLFGSHQVYNLLAGYAIMRAAGLSVDHVDTGAIQFTSAPMRGEILHSHGVSFIVDCYNANPTSVESGISSFLRYKTTGRRIAILGDMLELGADASSYHRRMGELTAGSAISVAVFVGPLSKEAYNSALASGRPTADTFHFPDARSCARETAALFQEGDMVFVKGSRGIGLEVVVEPWRVAEEVS